MPGSLTYNSRSFNLKYLNLATAFLSMLVYEIGVGREYHNLNKSKISKSITPILNMALTVDENWIVHHVETPFIKINNKELLVGGYMIVTFGDTCIVVFKGSDMNTKTSGNINVDGAISISDFKFNLPNQNNDMKFKNRAIFKALIEDNIYLKKTTEGLNKERIFSDLHQGIWLAYFLNDSYKSHLNNAIKSHNIKRVVFTGHSLGAALAAIANIETTIGPLNPEPNSTIHYDINGQIYQSTELKVFTFAYALPPIQYMGSCSRTSIIKRNQNGQISSQKALDRIGNYIASERPTHEVIEAQRNALERRISAGLNGAPVSQARINQEYRLRGRKYQINERNRRSMPLQKEMNGQLRSMCNYAVKIHCNIIVFSIKDDPVSTTASALASCYSNLCANDGWFLENKWARTYVKSNSKINLFSDKSLNIKNRHYMTLYLFSLIMSLTDGSSTGSTYYKITNVDTYWNKFLNIKGNKSLKPLWNEFEQIINNSQLINALKSQKPETHQNLTKMQFNNYSIIMENISKVLKLPLLWNINSIKLLNARNKELKNAPRNRNARIKAYADQVKPLYEYKHLLKKTSKGKSLLKVVYSKLTKEEIQHLERIHKKTFTTYEHFEKAVKNSVAPTLLRSIKDGTGRVASKAAGGLELVFTPYVHPITTSKVAKEMVRYAGRGFLEVQNPNNNTATGRKKAEFKQKHEILQVIPEISSSHNKNNYRHFNKFFDLNKNVKQFVIDNFSYEELLHLLLVYLAKEKHNEPKPTQNRLTQMNEEASFFSKQNKRYQNHLKKLLEKYYNTK